MFLDVDVSVCVCVGVAQAVVMLRLPALGGNDNKQQVK